MGINILQAYLESRDYQRGEQFLHRVYALERPDFKVNLDFYSTKFMELKKTAARIGPCGR